MKEVLIKRLYSFIVENNPDLLVMLQDSRRISAYLEGKVKQVTALITQLEDAGQPSYAIEEKCMDTLTADLRPSRFHYLRAVLEEEFEATYYRIKESGTLTYEIINIMEMCKEVFEHFGFCEENARDRHLHYAITGTISEYFEKK